MGNKMKSDDGPVEEYFDNEEWDLILNQILTHYDGGKFKYDVEQSSQSQGQFFYKFQNYHLKLLLIFYWIFVNKKMNHIMLKN